MNNLKYLKGVRKFIDEVLPQIGGLCVDIGNLNDIAMATTKHIEDYNKAHDAHSKHTRTKYHEAVASGATDLSYMEWVIYQLECEVAELS